MSKQKAKKNLFELTEKEKAFISRYRSLSPENKEKIKKLLKIK